MDNTVLFFERVKSDFALQEQLKAIKEQNVEDQIEAILALAREYGFQITKEDFFKHMEVTRKDAMQSGELDETELEAVAGGGAVEWMIMTVGTVIGCVASLVGRQIGKCAMDGKTSRF